MLSRNRPLTILACLPRPAPRRQAESCLTVHPMAVSAPGLEAAGKNCVRLFTFDVNFARTSTGYLSGWASTFLLFKRLQTVFRAAFWLVGCTPPGTNPLGLRRSTDTQLGVRRNQKIMSDERIVETRTQAPGWTLPAVVVLGLVAVGGLFFGWNASAKLDSTQQAVEQKLKTAEQAVQQDMSSLKDRITQDEKVNQDLQGDLKVVTGRLKITQGQLKKAREEATKAVAETSEKLTALDTSVHTELATKAGSDDLKNVDTKVGGVRTDLDTTREDLKMARSEMGTLIARNHDEIDQLRRLGEREYVEFTIAGKNKPQKIGNVTVELKGVNEKRNQYSVAMTVEDKQFEKKNRAMNEPIFFYISGTKLPQELVINKVGKNTVSGYVSIPKANSQPQTSTTSGK